MEINSETLAAARHRHEVSKLVHILNSPLLTPAFPTDPVERHRLFMDAFCADLASPEFLVTGKAPRADAVAFVARHRREPK